MSNFEIKQITVEQYKELINKTHQGYNILVAPEMVKFKNRFILGGFDNGTLTHAVVLEPSPALKIFKYANTGGDWISSDKEKDRVFLDNVCKWLKSHGYILWQIQPTVGYKEYDREGQLVENGFNNQSFIDFMQDAGFEWMNLGVGTNTNHQWTWHSVIDLKDFKDTGELLHVSEEPNLDYETVFQRIPKNTRYKIRKAGRNGYITKIVKGSEFTAKEWQELWQLINLAGDYHEFNAPDEEYTKGMLQSFDQNATITTVYDKDGHPAFSGLYIFTNTEAIYLLGGTDRTYANGNVSGLAHCTMYEEAIKRGMTRYNFGGISGYFTEDKEGYGVFRAKKEMGAKVCRSVGPFNKPLTLAGRLFLKRLV